ALHQCRRLSRRAGAGRLPSLRRLPLRHDQHDRRRSLHPHRSAPEDTIMATQSLMRRLPPVSVMIAGLVLAVMIVLVVFAPLIAPMDPRDVSSYSLIDMEIPPAF